MIPSFIQSSTWFPGSRVLKQIEQLRATWGKQDDRERDFNLIAMYHRNQTAKLNQVDDRTWEDLDFDGLFARIDRTLTAPGAQVLYHQMRTYEDDDQVLAERTRQHRLFRDNSAFRETLWRRLIDLKKPDAAWIAPLLQNPSPEIPAYARLFYLSSFFAAASLIGMLFIPHLLLISLPLVLLNVVVNLTFGKKITPYFSGFAQLTNLLGVAGALASEPHPHDLPQLRYLKENVDLMSKLQRRFGWFVGDRQSQGEIAEAIYSYLNLFFLFDILVFLSSLDALNENRALLIRVLTEVGSIDASLSVASYLEENHDTIVPEFADGRRLQVGGLRHPLVPKAVGNSFELTAHSALISGSNMAGKTTFIRTVGINLILARTLHFCHAGHAIFPRATVCSSIRREDRLNEGQSYFFAELRQLKEFVDAASNDGLKLFLIDEIFRGTNTIERIAASTAVLDHLSDRQFVLVTTHDIELTELLTGKFDMYHFSERFENGECVFDYRIIPGPVRSRNAIKLLELSDYPKSITDAASAVAQTLGERFDRKSP